MAESYCCEPFASLVCSDEYFHVDHEGRWTFGGDGAVVRVCPFCCTPAPEPWFDEQAIAMANAALLARPSYDLPGKHFVYVSRDRTNQILSYAPRDNPKRDTPHGRWSCYRVSIGHKWFWRDETTLYDDVRQMTTVHNEMRGPNYGARLTDDALYVIRKLRAEED